MSSQSSQSNPTAPVDSANKTALGKARAEVKDALARVKAEEKARKKAEEELSSCQADLKVIQADLDHERDLRIQAEHELTESLRAQVPQDDEAAPHVEAVERLMTKESDNAQVDKNDHENPSDTLAVQAQPRVPCKQAVIAVHRLKVLPQPDFGRNTHPYLENPTRVTPRFKSDEKFFLQTVYFLSGSGAEDLINEEYPIDIEVSACDLVNPNTVILTIYHGNLIRHVDKYAIPIQINNLPTGLHRLHVEIRCGNALGQRDGPVILVE